MFPKGATPSWMLAAGLAGFIAGVALASWGSVVMGVGVGLVVGLTWWGTRACSRDDRIILGLLVALGVGCGVFRYGLTVPGASSVANSVGHPAFIEGTVMRIEEGETTQKVVLDDLVIDRENVNDRALISFERYPTLSPGDRIAFSCSLKAPEAFEGFAYDRYLAAKKIYATCSVRDVPLVIGVESGVMIALERSRLWIIDRIENRFGDPHAALLAGLLIGADTFSDAWSERFMATGTSHVVAASGYNIAVVSSILMLGLTAAGLWRRQAFALVLVGLATFALIAGAEAAVVRAAVMGSIVLWAQQLGRKTTMRNVILLTVVSMLVWEPRLLRDDVGFQLSVASTLGLIAWTKAIEERLYFVPTTIGVRESLASTLAATIATLPIVISQFGRVSLFGPLVNLLILPLIPYAMAFGSAALVIEPFVWITHIALDYMLTVINAFAGLPFTTFAIDDSTRLLVEVVAVVAIALLARLFRKAMKRQRPDAGKMVALVVIGGALVVSLVFFRSATLPRASLSVWVFDIGQGDSIFIEGPDAQVLIDGGPNDDVVEKLTAVMPWWDRSIDYVVTTHPHADHINGVIEVLERYDVDTALDSGQFDPDGTFATYEALASNHRAIEKGEVIDLGDGATLTALSSPTPGVLDDPNDGSVVLLLEYGETSMLFTGDAGVAEEATWDVGDIDVLKVGHHGSDTSTGDELLARTMPEYALISLGEGNDYGHPSTFVVHRLEQIGAQVFRTDLAGDIVVESEGAEPTVRAYPLW